MQVLVAGENGTEETAEIHRQVAACRSTVSKDSLSRQTVARHAAATVWKCMSCAPIPGQWTLRDGTVVRYEDVVMLELVQVAKAGYQIILGYAKPQAQAQAVPAGDCEAVERRGGALQAWSSRAMVEMQVPNIGMVYGQDFGTLPPPSALPLAQPGPEFILDLDRNSAGATGDWGVTTNLNVPAISQGFDQIENVSGRGFVVAVG